MIHLEKIDAINVWDVLELKLRKEQKHFVASNDISIVQAYTAQGTGCSAFPFAIYNDKRVVGFLMDSTKRPCTSWTAMMRPPR